MVSIDFFSYRIQYDAHFVNSDLLHSKTDHCKAALLCNGQFAKKQKQKEDGRDQNVNDYSLMVYMTWWTHQSFI